MAVGLLSVYNCINHICNKYNLNKYALFTDSFFALKVDLPDEYIISNAAARGEFIYRRWTVEMYVMMWFI